MATIQSATGPIDSDDLGFTLMHEHVYVGWAAMLHEYPERFDFDEILAAARGRRGRGAHDRRLHPDRPRA